MTEARAEQAPPANPVDVTDRVVLVTGGTRGIGRVVAARFLAAGAKVMVCGRSAPEPPPGSGVDGTVRTPEFTAGDLRDPEQAAAVVDATVERFGRIDVLVNNAGGSPLADAATVSPRFVASIVGLNLLAPFYVAQSANVHMQQLGGGSIINIGSVSAHDPSPGTAAYSAAKAGLLMLTRALALEWGPAVRVNHVTVGLVETELSHLHYGDAAGLAAVAATIPSGRMATPADVAAACLYLASPLAEYVNGADLAVHGGGEVPARSLAARPTDTPDA